MSHAKVEGGGGGGGRVIHSPTPASLSPLLLLLFTLSFCLFTAIIIINGSVLGKLYVVYIIYLRKRKRGLSFVVEGSSLVGGRGGRQEEEGEKGEGIGGGGRRGRTEKQGEGQEEK